MMWGYRGGWGWGHWLGMGLGMTLFWALIIFGMIALVRYLGGGRAGRGPAASGAEFSDAERLLAERFARGEIDEQEYHQRREVLRSAG